MSQISVLYVFQNLQEVIRDPDLTKAFKFEDIQFFMYGYLMSEAHKFMTLLTHLFPYSFLMFSRGREKVHWDWVKYF